MTGPPHSQRTLSLHPVPPCRSAHRVLGRKRECASQIGSDKGVSVRPVSVQTVLWHTAHWHGTDFTAPQGRRHATAPERSSMGNRTVFSSLL
ncbi:hypothetical protein AAFF_G00111300 [Aldrovandia affinis]|uniref:Uncharacterized protein n=1 Tax=Aldrovandia affinis TaxID=143900 RepID=A0AAD7WAN4_9TELE|nr:hypothetical protein AAFF_G00111300 [Aldrovandia affinis]